MSDPELGLDVRPALPEDRDAVFAFCARTWPEGDYIPAVWDEWLADTEGALLVALADNRPVGLVHLRMMSPEEGWIEGIRVDPAARRQGIGRVLVSRALGAAHDRGADVVRLFTDHDNLPAQGLFARFGFTRIAEIVRFRAPALDNASGLPSGGAHIATPGDEQFERVWEWLVHSNLAPLTGGLEFDGWSARALSEPSLRAAMAAGQVLLLEEWDTILALAITQDFPGTSAEPSALDVRYMDGLSDGIGRLALALREVAGERGLSRVTLWLPDLLILHDAMDGAGYAAESGAMWVYSRTL